MTNLKGFLLLGLALAFLGTAAVRAEEGSSGKGSGGSSTSGSSGKGPDDSGKSGSGPKTEDSSVPGSRSGEGAKDARTEDKGGDAKPDDKGADAKPDDKRQGDKKNDGATGAGNSPNSSPNLSALSGLRRIALQPAPAAGSLNAKGEAETRVVGTRQRFKVEIELSAPSNSVFIVMVDGKVAGSIQLAGREGEFEAETEDGGSLPSGLNPVSGIKTVTVLDSNLTAVLEGTF